MNGIDNGFIPSLIEVLIEEIEQNLHSFLHIEGL